MVLCKICIVSMESCEKSKKRRRRKEFSISLELLYNEKGNEQSSRSCKQIKKDTNFSD